MVGGYDRALRSIITGKPLDIRRLPAEKGDMRDTFADTSLAQAELGFQPSHSLDEGLAAECRWLAAQLEGPVSTR